MSWSNDGARGPLTPADFESARKQMLERSPLGFTPSTIFVPPSLVALARWVRTIGFGMRRTAWRDRYFGERRSVRRRKGIFGRRHDLGGGVTLDVGEGTFVR